MTDPSPIPWVCVWIGCVIAIGGGIIAMSGWGQREPHRLDLFGKWIVGGGITLMFATILVNGAVIGAHVFADIVKTAVASAQPSPPETPAPTK